MSLPHRCSTVPPYFVPQLSDDVDVSYFDNVLKSPEKVHTTFHFRSTKQRIHTQRSTSFRAYYDRQVLNRRLGGRSTYQRQFSVNQDPFEADTDGENRQIPAWATPMKNRRRLHRSDQRTQTLPFACLDANCRRTGVTVDHAEKGDRGSVLRPSP